LWSKYPVINEELAAFEEYLETVLKSKNKFLNDATRYAVLSGGKRLRPAFTIIAALHGEYDRKRVFPAAASVEILHAATLVHDDIIDNAKTRRGKITLSEKHNTNLAVYTGDYLLTKSLKMLIKTGLKPEKLDVLARAITLLCEGEVDQYLNRYKVSSVYDYLKRIIGKTGVLFSASMVLGAKTANLSDDIARQFGRFGLSFGAAFQIRDDLLDIFSDPEKEGKPVLNDLKEGIVTLPVIMAIKNRPSLLKDVNEFLNGNGDINNILKSIKLSGGVRDSEKLKERYKEKCRRYIEKIPHTPYTDALSEIVNWL